MLVVIFAHPYPDRSRANRRLLEAASAVSGVTVRSLYDLYPAFDIDVPVEQAILAEASAMVWQHPLYWYSVPGLLKHWFDKVLARGWAYGEGTHALEGKRCLWVTTTGGDDHAYTPGGMHAHPFDAFVPPIEQTARFCKMRWEEPLILRGAHRVAESALHDAAENYAKRLRALVEREDRTANATP